MTAPAYSTTESVIAESLMKSPSINPMAAPNAGGLPVQAEKTASTAIKVGENGAQASSLVTAPDPNSVVSTAVVSAVLATAAAPAIETATPSVDAIAAAAAVAAVAAVTGAAPSETGSLSAGPLGASGQSGTFEQKRKSCNRRWTAEEDEKLKLAVEANGAR